MRGQIIEHYRRSGWTKNSYSGYLDVNGDMISLTPTRMWQRVFHAQSFTRSELAEIRPVGSRLLKRFGSGVEFGFTDPQRPSYAFFAYGRRRIVLVRVIAAFTQTPPAG